MLAGTGDPFRGAVPIACSPGNLPCDPPAHPGAPVRLGDGITFDTLEWLQAGVEAMCVWASFLYIVRIFSFLSFVCLLRRCSWSRMELESSLTRWAYWLASFARRIDRMTCAMDARVFVGSFVSLFN